MSIGCFIHLQKNSKYIMLKVTKKKNGSLQEVTISNFVHEINQDPPAVTITF